MKRLGIYPGTFDPIHNGHISFALKTIEICGLDGIIFLPENQPRHKINITPSALRAAQIENAVQDYPSVRVQVLESSQFTTKETLPEIQKYTKEAKLTLLVGSDVALSIANWSDINTLLSICDIAIGMRTHQKHEEVDAVISTLQKHSSSCSFTVIETQHAHLASSLLRSTT